MILTYQNVSSKGHISINHISHTGVCQSERTEHRIERRFFMPRKKNCRKENFWWEPIDPWHGIKNFTCPKRFQGSWCFVCPYRCTSKSRNVLSMKRKARLFWSTSYCSVDWNRKERSKIEMEKPRRAIRAFKTSSTLSGFWTGVGHLLHGFVWRRVQQDILPYTPPSLQGGNYE